MKAVLSLFVVVLLLGLYKPLIAQDSSSLKEPIYYKLDSLTDSIYAVGEKPVYVNQDSVKVFVEKSFSISSYILVALIFGTVLTVIFTSLGKKKEIDFKKWNLENREKLRNCKK